MNTRITASVIAALLALAVTGCGGSDDAGTDKASPPAAVPKYTVIKDTNSLAELLVENATTDSATAAIQDWLDKNAGGRDALNVQVVRSKDAGTIVCRAEYYADEQTAQVRSGGRVTSDKWPHTEFDCPDPAGS